MTEIRREGISLADAHAGDVLYTFQHGRVVLADDPQPDGLCVVVHTETGLTWRAPRNQLVGRVTF